jgi:phage regulator Rha-like protein
MSLEHKIAPIDRDCLLDSRLFAKYLGYKHRTVTRNIARHKGDETRKVHCNKMSQ